MGIHNKWNNFWFVFMEIIAIMIFVWNNIQEMLKNWINVHTKLFAIMDNIVWNSKTDKDVIIFILNNFCKIKSILVDIRLSVLIKPNVEIEKHVRNSMETLKIIKNVMITKPLVKINLNKLFQENFLIKQRNS